LKVEGGANVKLGDNNVSFVAADLYSGMSRIPTIDDEETGRAESYSVAKMGALILHELGSAWTPSTTTALWMPIRS